MYLHIENMCRLKKNVRANSAEIKFLNEKIVKSCGIVPLKNLTRYDRRIVQCDE
jgi:hypothetical protein